jgi:hypothetical protein
LVVAGSLKERQGLQVSLQAERLRHVEQGLMEVMLKMPWATVAHGS